MGPIRTTYKSWDDFCKCLNDQALRNNCLVTPPILLRTQKTIQGLSSTITFKLQGIRGYGCSCNVLLYLDLPFCVTKLVPSVTQKTKKHGQKVDLLNIEDHSLVWRDPLPQRPSSRERIIDSKNPMIMQWSVMQSASRSVGLTSLISCESKLPLATNKGSIKGY